MVAMCNFSRTVVTSVYASILPGNVSIKIKRFRLHPRRAGIWWESSRSPIVSLRSWLRGRRHGQFHGHPTITAQHGWLPNDCCCFFSLWTDQKQFQYQHLLTIALSNSSPLTAPFAPIPHHLLASTRISRPSTRINSTTWCSGFQKRRVQGCRAHFLTTWSPNSPKRLSRETADCCASAAKTSRRQLSRLFPDPRQVKRREDPFEHSNGQDLECSVTNDESSQ